MKPKISVIIRAFNEEKYIGLLFDGIARQKVDAEVETILVDSGSTDRTREIASRHGARIVQITPEQFTFGFSLNQGIRAALGEFCVIVSAHCYPIDEHWLERIVAPFQDPSVAYVFGKQRGVETTRYSEHQIFAKWFPDASIPDYTIPFGNNANSAVRRSVWEKRAFDETVTGLEDIEWAKRIRALGHKIYYEAGAGVFHIHEEKWKQVYRRYYREGLAYKAIFPKESFGFYHFIKFVLLNLAGDILHSIQDGMFFRVFREIFAFRFLQFWATYRAHHDRVPVDKDMQRRLYYPRRPKFRGFGPIPSVANSLPGVSIAPHSGGISVSRESVGKASLMASNYQVWDISAPLSSELSVWPGAKTFQMSWEKTFDQNRVNETHLSFNTHTGTHMDAPYHFVPSGKRMGDIPLQRLMGRALVLKADGERPLDPAFFEEAFRATDLARVKKVLLKTVNSSNPGVGEFNRHFVALTPDAARWLVDHGIELVGVDGPSVQCFHDCDNSTHEILLKSDVIVLEGLRLTEVDPGSYNLIALPLPIPDAEGAPVRAILTRGEIS